MYAAGIGVTSRNQIVFVLFLIAAAAMSFSYGIDLATAKALAHVSGVHLESGSHTIEEIVIVLVGLVHVGERYGRHCRASAISRVPDYVMSSILKILPDLISLSAGIAATAMTLLTAWVKIQTRKHLSVELSKQKDLFKEVQNYELALKRTEKNSNKKEIAEEITKSVLGVVKTLPAREREFALSALEQPSLSGRMRYVEQIAEEAARLSEQDATRKTAKD
jgi:hypothetical protein